jgi:hypothetical protein
VASEAAHTEMISKVVEETDRSMCKKPRYTEVPNRAGRFAEVLRSIGVPSYISRWEVGGAMMSV